MGTPGVPQVDKCMALTDAPISALLSRDQAHQRKSPALWLGSCIQMVTDVLRIA